MAFLSSCTKTVTTTVPGPGTTVTNTTTTTVTSPSGGSNRFICPVDGSEYSSLSDLQSHFANHHPFALATNLTTLSINGTDYTMNVDDMDTLSFVLRDKLGLFGTKVGCEMGQCGACTVLVDDVPIFACLVLAIEVTGKKITTVEALSDGTILSPLQQKFYDNDAFQCGYCTPGFIMAGEGLLKTTPRPTAAEVRLAISGHICVCGNIRKVVESITGGV